ncbi:DUF2924 domain-containing protein [Mesorhizobium sp. YM1C-6-2]|uniref:DUF2924 domain-containing protein n=1 Tax=Mesorhizobium sp. YM1C-6-2 TaxID=1827501 RepID=UPI0016046C7D|nr:DUF2924 domain-containing protein [Mesorhizobium sp. YM1C-6-2]
MANRMPVDQEVAVLGDLSREELAERWTKTYGHAPPKGARRDFLLRAAAWHLQANRLCGLSPDTRRMLRAATAQVKKQFAATRPGTSAAEPDVITSPVATSRRQLSPGTRLVREWNGRSHTVDVLEEGFAFEGRLHKSLTAIARQITGAHWSGPRFFGL